jgi:hypothetical protein
MRSGASRRVNRAYDPSNGLILEMSDIRRRY